MDRLSAPRRAWLLALGAACALLGCAGPAPLAPGPRAPEAPAPVRLTPAGSRLSVEVPAALERVPHALRWRAPGFAVHLADAEVEPGREREVAEAYLAQLEARHDGEVRHRPANLPGARGVEATMRGETARVRALLVWRQGAISRLTVVHDLDRAADAERVLDSLRFDPARPLDPAAALQLQLEVPPGLGLLPITNEQLIFRHLDADGARARSVGFPHPEPALDVAVLPFPDGGRPTSDVARGQLLGSRFAGLELGSPQVTALAGRMQGFAIVSTVPVDGVELSLYGAYLEGPDAVVLIRASVAHERAERWLPRFAELTLSVMGREGER